MEYKTLGKFALWTTITLEGLIGLVGCAILKINKDEIKGMDSFICKRWITTYQCSGNKRITIEANNDIKKFQKVEKSVLYNNTDNIKKTNFSYENISKDYGDKIIKSCEENFKQLDDLNK